MVFNVVYITNNTGMRSNDDELSEKKYEQVAKRHILSYQYPSIQYNWIMKRYIIPGKLTLTSLIYTSNAGHICFLFFLF